MFSKFLWFSVGLWVWLDGIHCKTNIVKGPHSVKGKFCSEGKHLVCLHDLHRYLCDLGMNMKHLFLFLLIFCYCGKTYHRRPPLSMSFGVLVNYSKYLLTRRITNREMHRNADQLCQNRSSKSVLFSLELDMNIPKATTKAILINLI